MMTDRRTFPTHRPAVHLLPRRAAALALCLVTALGVTTAVRAAPPACALTPDALSKALGVPFDAGKPEAGFGTGCVYRTRGGSQAADTDYSVFLGIVPLSGGTAPAMRKMMGGPGHEYVPVAGDPDQAVWVRHGGSVPPFPSISYERCGHLVNLHVSGLAHQPDATARARKIEQMNARLLKLPRLP
jgi:hypothetical protein